MKKSFLLYLIILIFQANVYAQTQYRVTVNGVPYYDGDYIYTNCNVDFVMTPQFFSNGSWTNTNDIWNAPTSSNYSSFLTPLWSPTAARIFPDNNSGWVDLSPAYGVSLHYEIRTASSLSFSTAPAIYGSNQSATYEVQLDNLSSTFNNATWETIGGARVNGGTSYTGGTSVTISTTTYGGILKVRANNTCGGSGNWNQMVVGIPYISGKTVNGSPSQSMNYVNGGAYLLLFTDNTATGANWNIDGGSGSISPYGVSCHAYPSPFMRLQATATNQFGSGESYMFYIQDNSYSGYRMASSNPSKNGDKIKIDFVESRYADDLVESLTLYNEKEKAVWSLSKKEAKEAKYFKDNSRVEIDPQKLDKGIYYLHLQIANKKYIERLEIE